MYVRAVHDLELLCSSLCTELNDSFNFPLRLIKYIVIVILCVCVASVIKTYLFRLL